MNTGSDDNAAPKNKWATVAVTDTVQQLTQQHKARIHNGEQ